MPGILARLTTARSIVIPFPRLLSAADADYEPSANQMSFEGRFMNEKMDLLVFVLLVSGCFRGLYYKEIQM